MTVQQRRRASRPTNGSSYSRYNPFNRLRLLQRLTKRRELYTALSLACLVLLYVTLSPFSKVEPADTDSLPVLGSQGQQQQNALLNAPLLHDVAELASPARVQPRAASSSTSLLSLIKPPKPMPRSSNVYVQTVQQMIERYFPTTLGKYVQLEVLPSTSKQMRFELSTSGSAGSNDYRIHLSGTNGVALASAFHHYLKYHLELDMLVWGSEQLDGDKYVDITTLPTIASPVNIESPFKHSFYLNEVTYGYSMPFWTWQRWQRELDWMSMRGINMMIVKGATEPILYQVFRELGISDSTLQERWFSSPGFEPWQRMGNIKGSWSGALTESIMQYRLQLTQQIIERMRDYGMITVLPAYNGFVPDEILMMFPDTALRTTRSWNGFGPDYCCDPVMDGDQALFTRIGQRFIAKQVELLGTDHYYNSDTFNENESPSADPDYLRGIAKSVYQSMAAADSDAIWVMQGWLFQDTRFWGRSQIAALLSGVPDDRMIILDLWSEVVPIWQQTDSFFGKEWIWCMLHNYGGSLGLYGRLDVINEEPLKALHATGSTMVGVGLTPEGINQNELIYEFMIENMWRSKPVSVHDWLLTWVKRRYYRGIDRQKVDVAKLDKCTAYAHKAMQLLYRSVYTCDTGQYSATKTLIELTPSFKMQRPGFMPTIPYWKQEDVQEVLRLLLSPADDCMTVFGHSDSYLYDIVDVSRQVISDAFFELHPQVMYVYQQQPAAKLTKIIQQLTTMIDDMDKVLATHTGFLLGRWIQSAHDFAAEVASATQTSVDTILPMLDYNSRNILTLWGPRGEIQDYGSKQWSGLISNYYKQRWQIWFDYVKQSAISFLPFDRYHYMLKLHEFSIQWQTQSSYTPPTEAVGDAVTEALRVMDQYCTPTKTSKSIAAS